MRPGRNDRIFAENLRRSHTHHFSALASVSANNYHENSFCCITLFNTLILQKLLATKENETQDLIHPPKPKENQITLQPVQLPVACGAFWRVDSHHPGLADFWASCQRPKIATARQRKLDVPLNPFHQSFRIALYYLTRRTFKGWHIL